MLLLVLPLCARAQVSAGEARLNLNGTVSAGYNDTYTNFAGSDHGILLGGNADLSGWYYNPGFLSFNVQPFYNQSRDNSNYDSVSDASGVTASVNIFSGTHYPGSVSYSAVFNGSTNYGLPGLANYTTHGNTDTLGISWGAHPVDLPSLDFSFTDSNGNYSLYGLSELGTVRSKSFRVTSAYRIAGFRLNGGDQYTALQSTTPEVLTGEGVSHSNSGTNSLFFDVSHNLPLKGSFSASANHLDLSTNYGETGAMEKYNTSVDSLSSSIMFAPAPNLSFGGSTYYTDNLAGTLYNTLVTAGVNQLGSEPQQSSHDLTFTGFGSYDMPARHLHLIGFAERQQQTFLGSTFASDSVNGNASYINTLLGGSVSANLGLTWTAVDTSHQSLLGVNSSAIYTREIQRWKISGSLGYSQDTQTILVAYTTSGFNYSGSIGRRIRRRSYWGAYASGSRTLLTGQPGTASTSQSYSTALSLSRFNFSGSYGESSGNALLTATGLATTTVPLPVINPADVVFFNGKSYSIGLGTHPLRGLTLAANFAKALSTTDSSSVNSRNNNENVYAFMTYHVRKISLLAGYSRLVQGFSVSGTPPVMVGSFYVGVSRWFNFF